MTLHIAHFRKNISFWETHFQHFLLSGLSKQLLLISAIKKRPNKKISTGKLLGIKSEDIQTFMHIDPQFKYNIFH